MVATGTIPTQVDVGATIHQHLLPPTLVSPVEHAMMEPRLLQFLPSLIVLLRKLTTIWDQTNAMLITNVQVTEPAKLDGALDSARLLESNL